ncbi:HPr(Ser) kinase/phosphatase [Thioalkalivibrio sp. ALgr3]|uniref:HPr(Ser) kinase/phosphatase n=1 Tax=Thioalkalivibrio sp. ALgr3 TaxID=1239292 RepID=UPI0003646F7D|nr:HPr(Ser) kinase/phosphatase [Thioalkalivibrio sp. ALgr3]
MADRAEAAADGTASNITIAALTRAMGSRLDLRYVHGEEAAGDRELLGFGDGDLPLAGHLNLIRPNRIQVIGDYEARYIAGLSDEQRDHLVLEMARTGTTMVIFAEDTCPFPRMPQTGDDPLPVILCTRTSSHEVIALLRYFLQQRLAHFEVRHGVFMEILGIGVLISGASSVGKSEVALELISRGHRLIADDAPEFARIAPDIVRGHCPALLQDLLEVRGLGVLNIRAMYGDSAIKGGKYLRLIIDLRDHNEPSPVPDDRLNGRRGESEILGLRIPLISLPVAPGRNIAVMIEAAVRNHLLHMQGYIAGDDLRARQRRQMGEDQQEESTFHIGGPSTTVPNPDPEG